jgi:hypothetical protein
MVPTLMLWCAWERRGSKKPDALFSRTFPLAVHTDGTAPKPGRWIRPRVFRARQGKKVG